METQTTDGGLKCCPNCGGVADNGHDRCDPPNTYYCTVCEDEEDKALAKIADDRRKKGGELLNQAECDALFNKPMTDSTDNAGDLLPCPFCGSEPVVSTHRDIVCLACGTRKGQYTHNGADTNNAMKEWNTRASNGDDGIPIVSAIKRAKEATASSTLQFDSNGDDGHGDLVGALATADMRDRQFDNFDTQFGRFQHLQVMMEELRSAIKAHLESEGVK